MVFLGFMEVMYIKIDRNLLSYIIENTWSLIELTISQVFFGIHLQPHFILYTGWFTLMGEI